LAAVAQNGLALKYASDEFKNDPAVLLAAVVQSGAMKDYCTAALDHAHPTLKASPALQWVAAIADDTDRAAAAADPATLWKVEVQHQAIAALVGKIDFKPAGRVSARTGFREPTEETLERVAAAAARVAGSQAAPLDIVDIGGNRYPLAAPGWWATPGGDLVAMALAQHPALVEADQRFELVTSDGAATPATVPLLLSGPTPPKAPLIWLSNDDDADASAAAPAAKRPRVE
jgi:hypothetical protein